MNDMEDALKRCNTFPKGYRFKINDTIFTVIAGPDNMGDYVVEWYDHATDKKGQSYFWQHSDIEEGTEV